MPWWLRRLYAGGLLATALLFSAGYATAGLLLLAVAAAADGIRSRTVPWRRGLIDLPIATFLGALLLSAWLSPHRPVAAASTGLAALTVYLAFGAVQRVDPALPILRPALLAAWVAGGVLTALWGIVFFIQTGQPIATPAIGHNAVGTTMLVALLLALGLALAASGRKQMLLTLGVAVLLVGVGLTLTRGAWLGAVTGLLVLAALQPREAWRGLAVVLTVAAASVALAGPLRPQLVNKATTIPLINEHRGRIAIARSALMIFQAYPLTGAGLNTFHIEYPRYQFADDISPTQPYAHNIFLNMAAEGGVLGLGAFALLIAAVIRQGIRQHRRARSPQEAMGVAASIAAFVGLLVHQQFDGTALSVHIGAGMWMLAAVLAAPASGHA